MRFGQNYRKSIILNDQVKDEQSDWTRYWYYAGYNVYGVDVRNVLNWLKKVVKGKIL